MLNFEAGEKTHKVAENWGEIKLSQAIAIMEVVKEFPEALRELYTLAGIEEQKERFNEIEASFDDEHIYKIIPELYGRIITIISDVSDDDINLWPPNFRVLFYRQYVFNFVYGLVEMPDFKAEGLIDFEFKGETYFLPESRNIMGNVQPFANVSALEFAEVADMEIHSRKLENGKYEAAANIVAILCRPIGEDYDEQKALERAETFFDLPMNIVWEVFFYSLSALVLWRQQDLIYLMEAQLKENEPPHNLD